MRLRNIQKVFIIGDIGLKIILKQDRVDHTAFNNRNDRFQFFKYLQIIAAPFLYFVNLRKCRLKRIREFLSVKRLCLITDDTQTDRFFCIVEFIVGSYNNKKSGRTQIFYFFHGINSVNARHLNIHDSNIGMPGFCKLDDAPAGLGRSQVALSRKIFFNDIRQGFNCNSLIVSKQNLIHDVLFLPGAADII